MVEPSDSESLKGLADSLSLRGFVTYPAESHLHPDLLAVHQDCGLVVLDLGPADRPSMVALNQKVALLRADLPQIADVRVARRIVDPSLGQSADSYLTIDDAVAGLWTEDLPGSRLESSLLDVIAKRLRPSIVFESRQRGALEDTGAADRARARVILDARQAAAARSETSDVLAITGPPGSGKTLVLAARARMFASAHPEWRIQLICYNKLLVPYLRSLVRDTPGIAVSTFGAFVATFGISLSMKDDESGDRTLPRALDLAYPAVDAILVDEWQDFSPAMTKLLLALLMPNRGGLTVAGDGKQSLYRSGMARDALAGREVTRINLPTPYRSTRSILEVTCALDPTLTVQGWEDAPVGEPVELVWADSKVEQAAAVACDVRRLLASGSREANQIAVLYTRRYQLGNIVRALKADGVPYEVAKPKNADNLDLSMPTVKIITVHSAKGYEFDVVFLYGLEELPDPNGDESSQQQGRVGYVGTTRARDQLVITYSTRNAYLERIQGIPAGSLRRWIWPDDYTGD